MRQAAGTSPAAGPFGRGGPFGGEAPSLLVDMAEVQTHRFETTLEILGELEPQAEGGRDVSGQRSSAAGFGGARRGGSRKDSCWPWWTMLTCSSRPTVPRRLLPLHRAGVSREQATSRNLLIQVERYRDLHREALISTQEMEELESRVSVAQAQLELAMAQVQQAEASLNELRVQQEQTQIYSPLEGFVGTRYLDPGALVSPSVSILSVLASESAQDGGTCV